MAKFTSDYVLEGLLARTAEADTLICCAGQPADFTAATTTNALADVTLTPGAGNGDFTLADGDTSGRKVTVTAQTGVPIDTTGDWDHTALCDSANSRLLHVTTTPSQTLTSGGTVDVNAFDVEALDVSA